MTRPIAQNQAASPSLSTRYGSTLGRDQEKAGTLGDYLDDCPVYGDSVYVEDRRASLRGRSIDLLVALGEGYEASGDRPSAAAAFREAVAVAASECPPAEAGLERLAARG